MENPMFNMLQLKEIAAARKSLVDAELLLNPAISAAVMHEIRKGLENGIDITQHNINSLNFFQIHELRYAMQDGVDEQILLAKDYSSFQMHELRLGLNANIDVTPYADSNIDFKTMAAIRHSIEVQHMRRRDISYCIDFSSKYNIFSLEDGKISKLTSKPFDTEFEARAHLEKILKVDNFYQKNIQLLGTLDAMTKIRDGTNIHRNIIANHSELKFNANYYILDENDTHAFAYNPLAPQPFVIWQRDDSYYFWGTYHNEFDDALLLETSENGLNAMKVIGLLKNFGAIRNEELEEESELGE